MRVHYDIQNDFCKGLDLRLTPIEGLILHSALLQYAMDEENNEIDRKTAIKMCDAYLDAMKQSANEQGIKLSGEILDYLDRRTEPQTDCYMCKWLGKVDVCGRCRKRNLFAEADTEPQSQTERHLPDYSYEADLGRRIMEQMEGNE